MTTEEFKMAIDRGDSLPEGLPPLLRALWTDRQGDWEQAHRITQDQEGRNAALVHAYLHRKEGDLDNARYWYGHAACPEASVDLETEWEQIAAHLLGS